MRNLPWILAGMLLFAGFAFAIEGSLDPTFGTGGRVSLDFPGSSNDTGTAVAIQSDGKMVAVGNTNDALDRDFVVVRYNTNGAKDSSFGSGGIVTTDFGGTADFATAVAIQSDGKIIVAGRSAQNFAVARYNTNGTLDSGFATLGLFTLNIGGNDQANAVKIQSDGKIVVAGRANVGGNQFAIVRLDSLGVPDTTFDGDGIVTTDVGTGPDIAFAVAIQADGAIVAAGGSQDDFAVVRYTTLGVPDISFNGTGIVHTDFAAGVDEAHAVAIQTDGKIVVAGSVVAGGGGTNFGVVRYQTNGMPDNTFDLDSKVIVDFATLDDNAFGVAIQSDGKIVVAGSTDAAGNVNFGLVRLTTLGAPDATFDGDGKATTDFGSVDESANGIAIQSSGKIVVAGTAAQLLATGDDIAVARYNTNGSPDNGFDSDGKALTDVLGPSNDAARAIARQTDGKIIVAGSNADRGTRDFAIARFTATGLPDNTFGTSGRVTTDFSLREDTARAIAIQSNGKIIVAGNSALDTIGDVALARYNTNGTLDTTFGTGGKVTTDVASGDDQAIAVAIQTDGKIVVAGFATSATSEDFLVARYTANGTLDSGFGTGGITTTDFPAAGNDRARAILIQADGKIILAGSAENSNDLDFALARYSTAGVPDTLGFGTNGLVLTDFANDDEEAFAMTVLQNNDLIVVGYTVGDAQDFAAAFYSPINGAQDFGMGNGGHTFLSFGSGDDVAEAVAVEPDGTIILGGTAEIADQDFALARLLTDGTPDFSFGSSGLSTTDTGGAGDIAHAIALQPDSKILLAGEWNTVTGSSDFALARFVGVCPDITVNPASLPQGFNNFPYMQAITAAGGLAPFTFAVTAGSLPPGLALDPATGMISGTVVNSGTFNFTITAADANTCEGSRDYSVIISPCSPMTLTPTTLPSGHLTLAYNQTFVATGGVAPYAFTVSSGALPSGLSINPGTGILSGTPTTPGDYSFDIQAEDSSVNNCTIANHFDISVTPCTFCDEFEDGTLSGLWDYQNPTWTETGGSLNGNSKKKAIAVATPAFAGCVTCTVETSIKSAGGHSNTLWVLGWYVDKKNDVEVSIKDGSNKWEMKQRSGNKVKSKASAIKTFDPNVFYKIKLVFDGTNFLLFVDDFVTPLITLPSKATVPTGTVGFQAKHTTGSFDYIVVY